MQLVLMEQMMVDSVPGVHDLSRLQDPGIQVLLPGWHTAPAGLTPLCSPPTLSAAATPSVRGFPAGAVVCPQAGALLRPVWDVHLWDRTAATLRMREGGAAANRG